MTHTEHLSPVYMNQARTTAVRRPDTEEGQGKRFEAMTFEEEAQSTLRPSTSRRRIGVSVLSLLALGGVIAVVANYASHVRNHLYDGCWTL